MKTFSTDNSDMSTGEQRSFNTDFIDNKSVNPYADALAYGTTGECPINDRPKFGKSPIVNLRVRKKVSVFDVAAYIVGKLGSISSMKLQKLVYYCQAWSLVWDEALLFTERIEAWANGPVIPDLFAYHRGQFNVYEVLIGNIDNLNLQQKETIEAVLNFYGDKPAQWLIDLSHSEMPWQEAREGLTENVPSKREISIEKMAEYYSSIARN
jgi:uncharacterized phage-associated protein